MPKLRTVEELRKSYVEVNKFLSKLEAFIKDEKEAQAMYIGVTNDLTNLGRIEPEFITMSRIVADVSRDEGRHEGIFTRMRKDTEQLRDRIIKEIKRLEDEEKRKLAQQVKEPHGRYGKRY